MTSPSARAHARQGLTFLAVGGASALVDAGVFWVLITIGMWPVAASALSFCSAFVINYRGNRDLVFRAKTSNGALARYTILVIANLGLSAGGVALGTDVLALDPLVAKIVTMILVALVNFVVMRLWVFRPSRGERSADAPSGPE